MTTRKRTPRTHDSNTVSVAVLAPFLVYHDGEQRSGVLHDVPADTAEHWAKEGWVTINDQAAPTSDG
jgi:hypothetical protein